MNEHTAAVTFTREGLPQYDASGQNDCNGQRAAGQQEPRCIVTPNGFLCDESALAAGRPSHVSEPQQQRTSATSKRPPSFDDMPPAAQHMYWHEGGYTASSKVPLGYSAGTTNAFASIPS